MERGETKWRSRDDAVCAQWMYTKHIHVLSTAFAATEIVVVKRRQKDGSIKEIDCPRLVAEYTLQMGGVDRFDQRRGYYTVSRRSKKWWLRILYFLFDTAVVNAHALHSSVHPPDVLSQLNFCNELMRGLLGTFVSRKRQQASSFLGRRRSCKQARKSTGVPENIRTSAVGAHMPQPLDKFRRCRHCSTRQNNKRSKIQCGICRVPLCVTPCFANFHTQKK